MQEISDEGVEGADVLLSDGLPFTGTLAGADLTGKKWSSQKKMKKSTNPKPTIAQPQLSHIQTCCESCALHTHCK